MDTNYDLQLILERSRWLKVNKQAICCNFPVCLLFFCLQAKRTKKVGIVGKYGTRYGASLRKMVKKIEISQHAKYTCSFCGKVSDQRWLLMKRLVKCWPFFISNVYGAVCLVKSCANPLHWFAWNMVAGCSIDQERTHYILAYIWVMCHGFMNFILTLQDKAFGLPCPFKSKWMFNGSKTCPVWKYYDSIQSVLKSYKVVAVAALHIIEPW